VVKRQPAPPDPLARRRLLYEVAMLCAQRSLMGGMADPDMQTAFLGFAVHGGCMYMALERSDGDVRSMAASYPGNLLPAKYLLTCALDVAVDVRGGFNFYSAHLTPIGSPVDGCAALTPATAAAPRRGRQQCACVASGGHFRL
jgi:hypothetical protein